VRSFDVVLAAAFGLTLVGAGAWLLRDSADRSVRPVRARASTPTAESPVTPPPGSEAPAYGEYVQVEEFPEPIRKVAPEYPEEARARGIEGAVVIQALVGTDGFVHDTRVAKSDPMFDAVSVAAVRQYYFDPAKYQGRPVAVWVAIPIRFKLD